MTRFDRLLTLAVAALLLLGWGYAIGADETSPANEKPAASQPTTEPVSIDLKDSDAVKAAMGKIVTAEGVVRESQWSKSGKILRIQFQGADKSHFLAVIFSSEREQFDKAYKGDVAAALMGSTIRVEGKLTLYKELPEIVIKEQSQLEILNTRKEAKGEAKQP